MTSSFTYYYKGTTIIICSDKEAKNQIGRDVLQESRDVAYPNKFSQLNQEGKTALYEVVLCMSGGPIYVVAIDALNG